VDEDLRAEVKARRVSRRARARVMWTHLNSTSQTAKNLSKPVPTSAAAKLPPKAVLTSDFFAPLWTTDTDAETTEAETTLPEQEALLDPGYTSWWGSHASKSYISPAENTFTFTNQTMWIASL
jgi:hypothetical protein